MGIIIIIIIIIIILIQNLLRSEGRAPAKDELQSSVSGTSVSGISTLCSFLSGYI